MLVQFEAAIDRIRNCAPENSTRCYNMPRAEELIITEQEAWVAWRNAYCDTFWFGQEGVSNHGEMLAVCRAELTSERTNEIRQIRAE